MEHFQSRLRHILCTSDKLIIRYASDELYIWKEKQTSDIRAVVYVLVKQATA
jgi:hypothetical protein